MRRIWMCYYVHMQIMHFMATTCTKYHSAHSLALDFTSRIFFVCAPVECACEMRSNWRITFGLLYRNRFFFWPMNVNCYYLFMHCFNDRQAIFYFRCWTTFQYICGIVCMQMWRRRHLYWKQMQFLQTQRCVETKGISGNACGKYSDWVDGDGPNFCRMF